MTSLKYTDRDNGERTVWDVVMTKALMLDGKPVEAAGAFRRMTFRSNWRRSSSPYRRTTGDRKGGRP